MTNNYRPTVSIVIPVYNRERVLGECLDSVIDLDYPESRREIIVVDNGSTDRTRDILASYGDKIRVLEEKVRGPGAARNRGVAAARNEVVAFTDSDCRVHPQWLKHLVAPLVDEEIGIVGGRILSKQPDNPIAAFGDRIHDHEKAISAYRTHYVISMNWASRTAVLKELSFDVRFIRSEDVDLSYRIQQAGYRLTYAAKAIIYHDNEDTLSGLLREGYKHGFWAVHLAKMHREYMAAAGCRRVYWRNYVHLLKCLRRSATGPDRMDSLCDFVFNFGKKVGKLFGSARFRHVDL